MHTVFLPTISTGPSLPVAPTSEQNASRHVFLLLFRSHPEQRRKGIVDHPILMQVAQEKCIDMAKRRYVGHTDPDGYGANHLARQAGYILPSHYSQDDDGNNIESLGWGGDGNAAGIWQAWHDSKLGHRAHLLGLNDFYVTQTNVGIGHYHDPGSVHGHYWALYTAPSGVKNG